MAEIDGVAIAEITGFGCSEDGQHVWLTHRLRDGSEYRLVYPYGAAGHLVTLFAQAARSASERRAITNPGELAEGLDTDIIPVEQVRVGTAPGNDAAILHLTSTDNVPIAVALSPPLVSAVVDQLQQVGDTLRHAGAPTRRLH